MRRRNRQTAMDLFAFQDVMASVIGIFFFVVIMLSLEAATEAPAAVPQPAVDETALKAEITRLTQRRDRILQDISSATDYSSAGLSVAVQRLVENLAKLDKVLAEEKAELKAEEEALGSARQEQAAAQAKLADAEARLRGLQDDVRSSSSPRVTFLKDEKIGSEEPWLVEVSARRVRVGTPGSRTAYLDLSGDTPATLEGRAWQWMQTQSSSRFYFVFIQKPDGTNLRKKLQAKAQAAGFGTGLELVPGAWAVFD